MTPALMSLFCPFFAGIQVAVRGLGTMEPTVGESQLVPRAAKDVPPRDAVCCRVALCAAVATSIVIVTLAVLVGKRPRACMGSYLG